jgi:dTDP-4-dehydrorhamnose reductase
VILAFGGTGQLGRELVRAATARQVALRALPRAEADIADAVAVAAALRRWQPGLVVNAAAYTNVDGAESHLTEARRANAVGPAVIAEACAAVGAALIHISTDYVFDGSKIGAYVESDPVCPLSVYGKTKAAGEEAVRRAHQHHVILRTAWLYSEFGHNFVKTVLRLAETRDELRIVADQHGSPTSARELAEAILDIAPRLAAEPRLSGTYHFSAAGATTWHGFATCIVAAAAPITGRQPRVTPITTADYPTPAKRPANSRLDCSLFAQTFGLSPRPWHEAVQATARILVTASQPVANHVA